MMARVTRVLNNAKVAGVYGRYYFRRYFSVVLLGLAGCSTSTIVDEYRVSDTDIVLGEQEKVVVLGRRQAGEYDTEPDFISCIGSKLNRSGGMSVVPELEFIDQLYPWFEPRVAPLQLKRMERLLDEPLLRDKILSMGVRYLIWVDGNTETTSAEGSVSCAIGPGGGGCYGFATWDKTSEYEAVIWDLKDIVEEGRVKVDASGTSYMIAVVAPIPFIAQVQKQACEGIGKQLSSFFSTNIRN